jgi:O-antigen/teichoic acid export membrane protein
MNQKIVKVHSIKYNILMNSISKVSSVIFPLITFPYISRILLATGNGKITFCMSVVNYFVMLASLGIPTYGIRVCAQCRDNRQKLTKTVQELLLINVICIICSYSLFIISMCVVARFRANPLLLLIDSISIILTPLGVDWFFEAIEQYDYITGRNFLFKVIAIVLMFIFVHHQSQYVLYGGITILASCGSNILNFYMLTKYIDLKPICTVELKSHLKPVFILFALSVAATIYTSLDSVMLGFISGDEQVGLFNAATKIKLILINIILAIGSVLLPRVSYYIENKMYEDFNRVLQNTFLFVIAIGLPLICYFIFQASTTIILLSGYGYMGAILPMQILMPTLLFIGLTNTIGFQILIPFGKEKFVVISTLVGAVVNILLNLYLIPLYGAKGTAISTLAAEGMVLIVQVIFVGKPLFALIDLVDIVKSIIATIISSIGLLLLDKIHMYHMYSKFIVTATIYFFIYGMLLLIFREKIIINMFNSGLNYLRKIT